MQRDGSLEATASAAQKRNPVRKTSLTKVNNNSISQSSIWAQHPSTRYVQGKKLRSIASLSNEKMYRQTYPAGGGDYDDRESEEFHPCVSNFKMPILNDNYRSVISQVEVLRESRSKHVGQIEEKIRTYTMDSNMNTTTKPPQPADPEIKFRSYVDNTVDMLNRFSI